MATLKDLLAQKEALEQQISELRKAEVADAISKVKSLVSEYGLTEADIFTGKSSTKPRKTSTSKVAAKYRDPATGKEWSGRGLAPKWLKGQEKSKFLIP
jgi:DNA-binding protein H-NS